MSPSSSPRKRPRPAPRKKPPVRMLPRAQVPGAVRTLAAPSGTARFAAGKALTVTAEKDPSRVYPHFEAIAPLLDSESKIVRWNAMAILAHLAPVDKGRKLHAVLERYCAFVRGSNLISAANAIGGLSKIVLSRPDWLDRILPTIFGVESAVYETPECRNVAIGQALDALQEHWPNVRSRPEVGAFVRRQRANTRVAVARRAERMTASLP